MSNKKQKVVTGPSAGTRNQKKKSKKDDDGDYEYNAAANELADKEEEEGNVVDDQFVRGLLDKIGEDDVAQKPKKNTNAKVPKAKTNKKAKTTKAIDVLGDEDVLHWETAETALLVANINGVLPVTTLTIDKTVSSHGLKVCL
jgi:hypothetical protein